MWCAAAVSDADLQPTMSAPTKMLRIKTEVKTIIIISSLRVGVWFLRKPRLSEGGQSRVLMLNNFPYMSVGERYLRVPRTTLRRGSRGEMLYTNNAPERLMVEDEIVESYNQLFLFSYFIFSTDEKSTEVINSDIWCVFLGSRTSFEPYECIPDVDMLSRQCLEDVDAQFTKIQVWKSAK